MQVASLVGALATALLSSGVALAQLQPSPSADRGVADRNPSELVGLSKGGEFNLYAELGAGAMLSSYQRDTLGYDGLGQTTLRAALNLTRALSAQASLGAVYLPSDQGSGQIFFVAQGARLDFPIRELGRLFADANFALADSVRRPRVGLDFGTGLEFPIVAYFDAGPFARYHQVFATTPDFPSDARFFSIGVAASLRRLGVARPAPRKPSDSDGDGVLDRDDLCPYLPSEPHPDAHRPGCPAGDRDHDGLQDPVDACPSEPQGAHPDPQRPGCPDRDDDADGIRNQLDACPKQKPLPEPDPKRPGCPAPDQDGDGIPDPKDACPTVRGVPSSDPARHGCPALVEVERDRLKTLEPVFFATNEDRILPASEALLRDIAEALRKNPDVRVSIEGHTDDTGTDAHNLELSRRRAESVKRELVRLGIEEARLEARGFGRSRPLVPATTPEAREKNRRVEFKILRPPAKTP